MTIEEKLAQITASLEALQTQAAEAVTNSLTAAEAKAVLDGTDAEPGLRAQVATLTAERDALLDKKALEDTQSELTTLKDVIDELRKPAGSFSLGGEDENSGKAVASDDPYKIYAEAVYAAEAEGKSLGSMTSTTYAGRKIDRAAYRSPWDDARLALRGDREAIERMTFGFEGVDYDGSPLSREGKAMTEGTNAQGGYLVRPQIERQLVIARELDNILRGLCSSINLTTNAIQLDQLGLSTTAGWVAELAAKPESTNMTLASITANIFTAAGLGTISNQLLQDSNPSIDGMVTADLAKRLVALEEAAFINGDGSGKPLGILQTSGLGATALTATDVLSLLDSILDACASVETLHGPPTAIVMHPRTWTRILKSRDSQGAYYVDPTGGPQDPRTLLRGPSKNLWGYPVVTTNRMPITLGGGTESRVIVGDFKEALILDRQGITVDESSHVLFTTNQTIFRVEERVGFTAARTPNAFNVVGGAGLAGG